MAWELKIHHIDVGVGESTLIVARDATIPQQRSILIDAGDAQMGSTVSSYLAAHLNGVNALDHMLATHYDKDHSGGITSIMIAELREKQAEILAEAAGTAAHAAAIAGNNNSTIHQIAAAAAAIAAASMGAYDHGGVNEAQHAVAAAAHARNNLTATTNDAAALEGYNIGVAYINNNVITQNSALIPQKNFTDRKAAATTGGKTAGTTTGGAATRISGALASIALELQKISSLKSHFRTNGLFRDTNIIDIGGLSKDSGDYDLCLNGQLNVRSNYSVKIPGMVRTRTTPNYKNAPEILWNSGANAMLAPVGAPMIFVVAANRHVRNAPKGTVPISQHGDNGVSIGLIVRFNNFYYYTGGDLPTEGEKLVKNDILKNPLPNPNSSTPFPAPAHICAFKCGHHGSKTSSSQNVVNGFQAKAAFISCHKKYGHPDQPTIDILNHGSSNITHFYLTNCQYLTNYVPASQGKSQWLAANNKGFIAGDNDANNLNVGRARGDIKLIVTAAQSIATPHQFTVEYYEADKVTAGVANPGLHPVTHTC